MSPQKIRDLVVYVAVKNLGFGEKGANNFGSFITAIGGTEGLEWCAAFAGYCYARAYELAGGKIPFRRSLGAKRLVRRLGAVGVRHRDLSLVRPGDLVAWHRGPLAVPWGKGHVGVVERVSEGILHTVEGNVGAFPARVRRLTHDVSKERLYTFAGLKE